MMETPFPSAETMYPTAASFDNEVDDSSSISSGISSGDESVGTKSTAPSSDASTTTSSECLLIGSSMKSVKIDEGSNIYHDSNYCQEDYEHLWYNKDDYQHFKTSSLLIVRMISNSSLKYDEDNDDDDRRAGSPFGSAFYYNRILETAYEACSYVPNESDENPLSEQEEKSLAGLFATDVGIARLGLERRTVKSIIKDKQRQREHLFCLVNTANWEIDLCEEHDCWGREMVAEQLRRQCENVTIPSRLFAQCLAQAQQQASL